MSHLKQMHVEFVKSVPWKKYILQREGANFWIMFLVVSSSLILGGIAAQPEKEVRSEADLPRIVYPVNGSVSVLLQSDDAAFAPLLQKAAADIHTLLIEYDIKDRATLISVLSAKLATQELNGETNEALRPLPR